MIRLAVRCRPELAEIVLAELTQLAPGGVEEDRGETYVEYAIYGEPGEVPSLPALEAAAGDGLVEIETNEIPDDWGDRWRDFHRAIEIEDELVVRPSWVDGRSAETGGRIEVVIDPGQAFGTGSHATTSMCLRLLLELRRQGRAEGTLADLGTGSGVLAIAAAKLGWRPVLAVDHERAAVEAARKNAAANGVELDLSRLNLRDDPPPAARTLVANLTAPLLASVTERLSGGGLTLPSWIVCSGLLGTEVASVQAEFAGLGMTPRRRLDEGEWSALLLEGG